MSERKGYRCCCGGWMVAWRGTDGHNGVEWFYTCDRCGTTS